MECNMGITIFVNEVMIWKANGVPLEYFSVDQATNREENDDTNDNDHEDSVVDDASCKVS